MHALWDYPAAACVFFVLYSCRPLGARLASHFLWTGSGFALENRESGDLEKIGRCTGCLIVLLAYEVQYLICLEFRGRFTLFETKARISVNEIRRNCENLILKRPADAYCSR